MAVGIHCCHAELGCIVEKKASSTLTVSQMTSSNAMLGFRAAITAQVSLLERSINAEVDRLAEAIDAVEAENNKLRKCWWDAVDVSSRETTGISGLEAVAPSEMHVAQEVMPSSLSSRARALPDAPQNATIQPAGDLEPAGDDAPTDLDNEGFASSGPKTSTGSAQATVRKVQVTTRHSSQDPEDFPRYSASSSSSDLPDERVDKKHSMESRMSREDERVERHLSQIVRRTSEGSTARKSGSERNSYARSMMSCQKQGEDDELLKALDVWQPQHWNRDGRATQHEMVSDVDQKFKQLVLAMQEKTIFAPSSRHWFACMDQYIISPVGRFSMVMDFLFVVLIMYDCVQVPMMLLDPGDSALVDTLGWISRICWTLAIPRAFLTGYMQDDGHVEMTASRIARHYRRTWLLLDAIVVLADWLVILERFAQGELLRMLRMIKAARLARMIRVPTMIIKKLAYSKTEQALLWVSIFQNTVFFVFVCHFVACIWYGVGKVKSPGWVTESKVEGASLTMKYTYAAHWAASQFIGSTEVFPKNEVERGFGTFIMVFAFIWSASFISKITAAMTRLQLIASKKGMMYNSLRQWLSAHNITDELGTRIMTCARFFVEQREKHQDENDVELLKVLSEPLLIEIHYDVNCQVLGQHQFFKRYNHFEPQAVMKICHSAIATVGLGTEDVLFTQGEEPTNPRMFFALNGLLLYLKDFDGDGSIDLDEMVEVREGMWLCEPVLWMSWVHMGSLRAATNSTVLTCAAKTFQAILRDYKGTPYPSQYALLLVEKMNEALLVGEDLDDLLACIDIGPLCSCVFPHALLKRNNLFTGLKSSSPIFESFGRSQSFNWGSAVSGEGDGKRGRSSSEDSALSGKRGRGSTEDLGPTTVPV